MGQTLPAQQSGKLPVFCLTVRSTGLALNFRADTEAYNEVPRIHRPYHYCYLI